MNRTDSQNTSGRKLTTADLAAAGRQAPREAVENEPPEVRIERERIERERQNERAGERIQREPLASADERAERARQNDRADQRIGTERAAADLSNDPPEARRTEARDPAAAREQHRSDSASARGEDLPTREREKLEPLFPQDVAERYRSEWAAVQSSFVDDPRRAAARGDELVAQVMKGLAESFAHEREQLEQELSRSGEASTETLRIGFRRYRSFFERLLAL